MSATTLLNFEYVINTLLRAWGSVSMLSHCLMPGFLLIVLFSSWTYKLAFLSLRRMLKINLSVCQSHIHRKLTFRCSLPNLSPPCAEYDAHKDVAACEMVQCLPLFCTLSEWLGCCGRVHISLSPLGLMYFMWTAKPMTKFLLDGRPLFVTFLSSIFFFIKHLGKINVNCLSLRHLCVSFVKR